MKYVILLLVIFCVYSCKNVQPGKYTPPPGTQGIGIGVQIPIWSDSKEKEQIINFEKTNFPQEDKIFVKKYEFPCYIDKISYYKEASRILQDEGFKIEKKQEHGMMANKEVKTGVFTFKYSLRILHFKNIEFESSKIPDSVIIVASTTSKDIEPKSYTEDYIASLYNKLSDIAKKKELAGFGFAKNKKRTPETDDEKIIYEKFGEKGLSAIDLIDGKNTIEEISNKSGMTMDEIINLINFLQEKGLIKFK